MYKIASTKHHMHFIPADEHKEENKGENKHSTTDDSCGRLNSFF